MEQFIAVGFQNYVALGQIVAIMSAKGLCAKRLRDEAHQCGKLLDASQGRKMKSQLVTISDHVLVSSISPETLQKRIEGNKKEVWNYD